MKQRTLVLLSVAVAVFAMAACSRPPPLGGRWIVDIGVTIVAAEEAGIPDELAPRIRDIYDGGQLEITRDTLVMRVAGYPEAISRNYKVVSTTGHCHGLEINGAPGVHEYCIENGRLTVEDPSARFAVVYREASR